MSIHLQALLLPRWRGMLVTFLLLPILLFLLAIWGFVALAYSLSWRHVRSISLAEVLRDDTML